MRPAGKPLVPVALRSSLLPWLSGVTMSSFSLPCRSCGAIGFCRRRERKPAFGSSWEGGRWVGQPCSPAGGPRSSMQRDALAARDTDGRRRGSRRLRGGGKPSASHTPRSRVPCVVFHAARSPRSPWSPAGGAGPSGCSTAQLRRGRKFQCPLPPVCRVCRSLRVAGGLATPRE